MDSPCINEGRHQLKYIEPETSRSLHKVNIFFAAKGVIEIFQREIPKEFFGRLIGNLPGLFALFSFLVFLIELSNLFAVKSDWIINTVLLQHVNITDRFV